MIKRTFIKVALHRGESLNREDFNNRACVVILAGSVMVFNNQGRPVFRLDAGDANVFDGNREFTGTVMTDHTEVIIV
ncbi:MAG: rpoB protein [Bacteroides sp.]|nr:rpoB protein [Bacteroides sp.]